MQGDPEFSSCSTSNDERLTAINQYFLHSKMQDNLGLLPSCGPTRVPNRSTKMRHAEASPTEFSFWDGLRTTQRLFPLRVGQTLREQFEATSRLNGR